MQGQEEYKVVGPLTAAEVRSARADEKARVESVMEARAVRVKNDGMAFMKSTIRKRKFGEKKTQTKPKSKGKSRNRKADAEEKMRDLFTGKVGTGETGGVNAEVELGAGAADAEETGAEDPHVASEEEEGATGLSNAEDEKVCDEDSITYTENKSAAAEEEVGVEDLSPAVEEKGVREAAEREVEQQSTGVASVVLGGVEGVLLGSPSSAGEEELGGSSDEECSSSLPSPSKCQRTQGPTEVTGK